MLSSIEITKNSTKTVYEIGEELDTEGLEITAKYSDETSKVVTGWTVSGFDSSEAAEKQTLTVSYKEAAITKTATFDVMIKENALGTNSEGGRPSLEAVKGGIKITVRINKELYFYENDKEFGISPAEMGLESIWTEDLFEAKMEFCPLEVQNGNLFGLACFHLQ